MFNFVLCCMFSPLVIFPAFSLPKILSYLPSTFRRTSRQCPGIVREVASLYAFPSLPYTNAVFSIEGKAIPVQAWRSFRLPYFKIIGT
jgi:hypothetical protein